MRKLKVRQQLLPEIGQVSTLDTSARPTVTVGGTHIRLSTAPPA